MASPLALHYIYDPLCGWCYGSSPLVQAAAEVNGIELKLHAGGMLAGDRRQRVTEGLRQFVVQADQRIASLTGQPFGEDYKNRLLRDETVVLDSEPPITAILAAESFGQGLAMLQRIQKAHYIEGRKISDTAVLADLAADIGLDRETYSRAFENCAGEPTRTHIEASRALLHQVGGAGFPTFAMELDGRLRILDSSRFLGRPDAWREALSATSAVS
jgi:putative protein-disulfide isomerase